MAGAAVDYVVKTIGDLLIEEARFLSHVDKEVDQLRGGLRAMACFLEDADAKRKRDEAVENWVADVRNAAYEAEDLVESFALGAERTLIGQLPSRHDIGTEIDRLCTRINDIEERSHYGIPTLLAKPATRHVDEQVAVWRRVSLPESNHDVVGMEDENAAIVARLSSERVKRRAVVSIVGMGGLGKTTLAKKVYDNPGIKSRFDRAVWIDVSPQYRDKELLQDLVLQVSSRGREELREMSWRELEDLLNQSLQGKKYLIVMDNVWDTEVWRIVGPHLPDEGNGSRVLITTRSYQVARAADPSTPPHELRFLDDNESWELFLKNAFPEDGRRSYPWSNFDDEKVARWRRAILHSFDHDVAGVEDEKMAIVAQLTSERVKRRAVVSIVGMRGPGKTTLAKKVYNDHRINSSFDCTVWIDVFKQYRDEELLKDLVLQVLEKKSEPLGKMSKNELTRLLHKSLQGKKYLIVMDDVWDTEVWRIVKPHLPDENNGSRVLITTRSAQVARDADPFIPPHELRFLNKNESWKLFLKKAFSEEEKGQRPYFSVELKWLGRKMVGQCGGLPLALTVLGGLLSKRSKSVAEWDRLERTMIWQEDGEGQNCMKILRLSYANLPQHLKWCFLYLGAFPEDMEIEVEKLIRLWIAEGFVEDTEGLTLEESAEGYLAELVQRCLVQVVKRSNWGLVKWGHADPLHELENEKCRIHDLLRELSIAEAQELNFLICQKEGSRSAHPYSTLRRLSLHAAPEEFLSQRQSTPTPSLRTLLGFNFQRWSSPVGFPAGGLKLIRVIDLEGAPIEVVPEQVGDMANLRYLGLRNTAIKLLPTSVERLSRLQFLDLRETRILQMPSAVWRIKTLRQVLIPWRVEPRGIYQGNMRALQILESARAGDWINSILPKLTNLQTLGLTDINGAHHEGLSATLPELKRLAVLELDGKPIPEISLTLSCLDNLRELILVGRIRQVPRPRTLCYDWPRRLLGLTLRYSMLDKDPLPSLGQLRQLRTLRLHGNSYLGKEMTCPRDAFPELRTLRLDLLPRLERWTLEEGAMLRLENLKIMECRELKMLPQGLQGLTSLEELILFYMSAAFNARVEEGGDDWDKIRHIPSIRVIN